jgi:hypothetical protein
MFKLNLIVILKFKIPNYLVAVQVTLRNGIVHSYIKLIVFMTKTKSFNIFEKFYTTNRLTGCKCPVSFGPSCLARLHAHTSHSLIGIIEIKPVQVGLASGIGDNPDEFFRHVTSWLASSQLNGFFTKISRVFGSLFITPSKLKAKINEIK